MDVAIRLFAERGFDAVSVRDITKEAQVNLGAVNYHFESKEQLIHEIFETLLGPLHRKRFAVLEQLEAQAGEGPLDLEQVLRALIEPAIQNFIGEPGSRAYLPRLMFQAYAVSRPFLNPKLAEQNDYAAKRFIEALARAAPDIPFEEICWRYYLILGGLLMLSTDAQGPQRLRRLSAGSCETDDADHLIEEMVAFFLQGVKAPPPVTGGAKTKKNDDISPFP